MGSRGFVSGSIAGDAENGSVAAGDWLAEANMAPFPDRVSVGVRAHPPPALVLPLQAGVEPNTAIWNSMLGAYAKSGSVDGAYATWLRMLESGERRVGGCCV